MILTLSDPKLWEEFVYNLTLVAPGKGEAKKTVSKGFIRIELSPFYKGLGPFATGVATDDILSIFTECPIVDYPGESEGEFHHLWSTVEALKAATPTPTTLGNSDALGYSVNLECSPDYDAKFDRLFWVDHVLDSISGEWEAVQSGDQYANKAWSSVRISPDRLRKFSLLKPQGQPILWEFGEWADRDIIRWSYEHMEGVYVPLD